MSRATIAAAGLAALVAAGCLSPPPDGPPDPTPSTTAGIGTRAPATTPPTTTPPKAPAATKPPTTRPATRARYRSCAEARAAGAAPLRPGDPGWNPNLDRDGDGVACET